MDGPSTAPIASCLSHATEDMLLRGLGEYHDDLHDPLTPSKEKPKTSGIGLEGTPRQGLDRLDLSRELSPCEPGNIFQDTGGLLIRKVIQRPLSRSSETDVRW